jgi:hypothetical protein
MNSKEAIKKIMEILNFKSEKFYDAKTDQGIMVKMEGDSLEVGKTLYVATDEGMIPAPAGIHKLEDGSEIEVGDDGKVAKIKMSNSADTKDVTDDAKKDTKQQKETENKPVAMAESEETKIEMEDGDIKLKDGSVLRIGGESTEVGTRIKKVGYDGTLSAIADGAYETADGKVMQVVGGEIKGIQSKAAEDARGGKFTEATSADGAKLDSPSFDVGEEITMKKDDGTSEPAPDGEYELILKDTEGNDTKFTVTVMDGKIDKRENIEEPKSEEDQMGAFVDAFAQAMKRIEVKLDEISKKSEVLEAKFKKFSNEPAGDRVKRQINQEFSTPTNSRLEGFRRLRETMSHNN